MAPTHKQKRLLLKFLDESIRHHPEWPVIFSEGDSWFSFPIHFNTIDHLDQMAGRKISLLRLEKNGDRALRMVSGKQKAKLARYMERYKPAALLFSGGGNDVVGQDLRPLLRERQDGMTWRECIHDPNVAMRMQKLRNAYLELVSIRDDAHPKCRIYYHGYDYAIPSGIGAKLWGIKVGPWMRQYFVEKKILDEDDQKRIIKHLIDEFNDVLEVIDSERLVTWVRTRRCLSANEWNDELHPTRKGFKKIAEKFRKQLVKQFPNTF